MKIWKQPKCPVNGWVNKENLVYTYNEIVFSLKKVGIPAVCNFIDGPGEYYVKWNKPDTDKYCMISFIRGI